MKTILTFFAVMMISFYANAQTTYPSGVTGCIARWTFDGGEGGLVNIPDVSGNNHHGINNNITSSSGWKNIPMTAGDFNGTSSWAEVVHDNMLNVSNVTMICLIKMKGFNSSLCEANQFISKGYPYFVPGNYGLGITDDTPCGTFNPNGVRLITQNGNGSPIFTPSNFISLNEWYFFASTIGSSNVSQYQILMDPLSKAPSAVPINSYSNVANIGTNSESISIGKHLNPNFPYWINADMDELILFNRALSDSEIYSVYEYLYGSPTSITNNDFNNIIQIESSDNTFKIISNVQVLQVKVYDLAGKLILKNQDYHPNELIHINSIAKQLYFVEVVHNNQRTIKKGISLKMIKKIVGLIEKILSGKVALDYKMLSIKRDRVFKIPSITNYIRINTFELVVKEILENKVEGEVAELGVYKGEFAKFINMAFPNKKLYLFDTFEGFDEKDIEVEKSNSFGDADQDFSNTSIKEVLAKMKFPSNCIVKQGWFPESLNNLEEKFCFVSLDADLYKPIYDGLEYFYPRLSKGGYIFIHDYNNDSYPGAKQAVREYCNKNNISYAPMSDSWGSVIISK